ncbi:Fe(3+) ABC transporter substrate-binding protein [Hugenholtzia roseola]|uniref:Fe(3+) ABC transporter substrate-binding protein n=1 Tax=Hugenholtzia roseola TaxID=1002 RepID=UPI00040FC853|nr:Fe(3+) ABC transporter substrate-binding protein [Hugenholtzia roseola]
MLHFKKSKVFLPLLTVLSLLLGMMSCQKKEGQGTENQVVEEKKDSAKVVNLYSQRHYASDDSLYKIFEERTGIKVNVVKASADELMNKMEMEGADSPADLFITADAGRLQRAKMKGLLQPLVSETLNSQVPAYLRDADNQWFALTTRARVIVFDKKKHNLDSTFNYENLADAKWKGKLLIRSSENPYNQSLMASILASSGEEAAEKWAKGVVANMAREPKGGDRDQIKAIAAGEGEIAVVNSYYLAQMLKDQDEEVRKAAEMVGVCFPNQSNRGTHINISGAGIAKNAPNLENARLLLEFLTSAEAQATYANSECEFPLIEGSDITKNHPILKDWNFKADKENLQKLGEFQEKAILLFDKVMWK